MKKEFAVGICGRGKCRVFSRNYVKEHLKQKPLTIFEGRLFVKVSTRPLRYQSRKIKAIQTSVW